MKCSQTKAAFLSGIVLISILRCLRDKQGMKTLINKICDFRLLEIMPNLYKKCLYKRENRLWGIQEVFLKKTL